MPASEVPFPSSYSGPQLGTKGNTDIRGWGGGTRRGARSRRGAFKYPCCFYHNFPFTLGVELL